MVSQWSATLAHLTLEEDNALPAFEIPKRNLDTGGAKLLAWRSSTKLNAYAPNY
jgi:hypothetical protein